MVTHVQLCNLCVKRRSRTAYGRSSQPPVVTRVHSVCFTTYVLTGVVRSDRSTVI